MEKIAEEIINKFFTLLQITLEDLKISVEEENIYNVKIKTPDSWIIIWPHGRNIDSVQSILRLMLSKYLNKKISLHLEVNDYMKTKDDRLFEFIKSKIATLSKPWTEVKLPFLNSYERKKVHSFVADLNNSSVSTKSKWEGKERRLFICKEVAKLTIDIDWDDI